MGIELALQELQSFKIHSAPPIKSVDPPPKQIGSSRPRHIAANPTRSLDGGVEVHANLDEEDGKGDGSLLACRKGEAETVIAAFIVEHDLVVGAGWRCDGLFELVVL